MDRRKILGATLIALSTLCEAADQGNPFTLPPILKRHRPPVAREQVVSTEAADAVATSQPIVGTQDVIQAVTRVIPQLSVQALSEPGDEVRIKPKLTIVTAEESFGSEFDLMAPKASRVKDACIFCIHQRELAQGHRDALRGHGLQRSEVAFRFPIDDSDDPFATLNDTAAYYSDPSRTENEDPLSLSASIPMGDSYLRKRISLAPMEKACVLSLDGGGVKALLQLDILARIERKTGLHTTQIFDMIGGTSAGAEIALLLTLKDPVTGRPKYSAEALRQILLEKFPTLFQSKGLVNFGLFREKYKITPVREMLRELAGTAQFGDAIIPTFVTAFNISAGATKYDRLSLIASYTERDISKSVVDVGLSSLSAPVAFKAHASEDGNTYLDGGLVANNPSLLAYSEAKSYFARSAEIVLVSLGAGKFESVSVYDGLHTGLASIGPELVNMFLEGQQSITQRALAQMGGVTSFRIDPLVEGSFIPLEDATPDTIRRLEVAANRWWESEQGRIAEITARLERT